MKVVKRIIFFFSFAAFYFIGKEFLELYLSLRSIDPVLSIVFLIVLFFVLLYFVVFPVISILKLPKYPSPTDKGIKEKYIIRKRITLFKKNQILRNYNIDCSGLKNSRADYREVIEKIKIESKKLRDDHVKKIFLSTAIAQNGFIDGIILMSASVNIVKQTFILFGGRVSYKDLLSIAKAVYYSIIISASEGVETGVEELIEKVGPSSIKSIPFAGKILESFADGFVSATLLCRVGLITENYCTKTFIESEKELYPGIQSVLKTVNPVAVFIRETILKQFKKAVGDKVSGVVKNIISIFTKEKDSIRSTGSQKAVEEKAAGSAKTATRILNKIPLIRTGKRG